MANIVKKHPKNSIKRKIPKILSTVKTPCFFVHPEKSPPAPRQIKESAQWNSRSLKTHF